MHVDQDRLTDGSKDGDQDRLTRKVIPRMDRRPEIFNLTTKSLPILIKWHTPRSGMGTPGPVRRMADATKIPFPIVGHTPMSCIGTPGTVRRFPMGGEPWGGPGNLGTFAGP